ncbi:MAG: hypothetical protein ACXWWJ_05135, partial [Nitrospira sp.]
RVRIILAGRAAEHVVHGAEDVSSGCSSDLESASGLVRQAFAAVEQSGVSALAVVGGVSANSRLRARLAARAAEEGIELSLPALSFCTDNAAMIAAAGRRAFLRGKLTAFDCEAMPNFALPSPTDASSGGVRQ